MGPRHQRFKAMATRGRAPWQVWEVDWAALMFARGLSCGRIGPMLRRLPGAVYNRLKRDNLLAVRDVRDFRAKTWESRGYIKVTHDGREMFEHRVVAEQMLGRPLDESEVVHHKNGDRKDNRPGNLEVFPSHSAHMEVHREERTTWTAEEDAFLKDNYRHGRVPWIAAQLGCSIHRVRNRARRLQRRGELAYLFRKTR